MAQSVIMVVEDDPGLQEALAETLTMTGYEVVTANDGEDALRLMQDQPVNLVVSDIQMPNMDGHVLLKKIKQDYPEVPMMLMTAYGTIQQAVDAMRDGAVDYMVKPFEAEVLLNMVSRYIGEPSRDAETMIAVDAASQELVNIARRVAQSDATVMITGESGVGKEVLARFIHENSERAEQAFIAINCAAIPENMLEATLFGYEKGAYTGAYKACPGKFEQAQGGTLLLDEITEMDLGLQAKLLRVLQEKEVERLGGNKVIELDVRVIATSNRNLRSYVSAGNFREDLFYRLNVFPLYIQALRDRQGDILPVARQLLERQCRNSGTAIPEFTQAAINKLLDHTWPGNVRELDNVIQRALILYNGVAIDAAAIHFEMGAGASVANSNVQDASVQKPENADSLNDELKQREWQLILKTISSVRGSRKKAAEILGISQRTLRYKLARMRDAGIELPGRASVEAAS